MRRTVVRALCSALGCALLASCAFNYDLRAQEGPLVSQAGAVTVRFSNRIKMSTIDDKPFSPKFSIWAEGSHEVTLAPGVHKFSFKYNAVSGHGGLLYTTEDTVLSSYMEAGKNYEIFFKVSGRNIRFKLLESGASFD